MQCVWGHNEVVGIWVQVVNGTSGWATRWNDGYGGNYYSYPPIDQGKQYSVHVGCSGTSQNWGGRFYSPVVTGYQDWICTYLDTEGNICYQS